jgi:tripartite-type tricarboxylate transporter receptor subunit TctC
VRGSGLLLTLALLACGGFASHAAQSPQWPVRPVRLIVPFAPGGANDIVARILSPALSEALGQQFVIDNRAGAAGNMGTELVAKAQPDGHTILVGNVSTNAINPIGFAATLKFDAAKELTGVVMIARVPNLLVSGAAFPPANMKELLDYARARPGQLNYSNPIGAYSHLDMLDFTSKAGIRMVNIPSKGAGSSFAAAISGEIHFYFTNAATVTSQVLAGRMKAFATTAQKRLSDLPEVPTMAEAGFPGVGSEIWIGLFLPLATPRAIISRLDAAVHAAALRPQVQEAFARAKVPLALSATPAEFNEFVRDETKKWTRIIRDNDVKFY